jgi:uncharacterized CHY-type Zn-finger protein
VTLRCTAFKSYSCCIGCHAELEERGFFEDVIFTIADKDFHPLELRVVGCCGFGAWVVSNLEAIENGKA